MNKFMKKIMSKKDGFTLVELIVVIAILAILAGVAVPAYSGYITKANDAADTTALAAVGTAAQATMAKTGAVTVINIEADGSEVTKITINGTEVVYDENSNAAGKPWLNADFAIYMNNTMVTLKGSYKNGAVWFADDTAATGSYVAGWNVVSSDS